MLTHLRDSFSDHLLWSIQLHSWTQSYIMILILTMLKWMSPFSAFKHNKHWKSIFLPAFGSAKMLVEINSPTRFPRRGIMAYTHRYLFSLTCPWEGLNSVLWDHKPACYQFSHPYLFSHFVSSVGKKIWFYWVLCICQLLGACTPKHWLKFFFFSFLTLFLIFSL